MVKDGAGKNLLFTRTNLIHGEKKLNVKQNTDTIQKDICLIGQ